MAKVGDNSRSEKGLHDNEIEACGKRIRALTRKLGLSIATLHQDVRQSCGISYDVFRKTLGGRPDRRWHDLVEKVAEVLAATEDTIAQKSGKGRATVEESALRKRELLTFIYEGEQFDEYVDELLTQKFKDEVISRLSALLKDTGWRIDCQDRGEGCTHPKFNLKLVVDEPRIEVHDLKTVWKAQQYHSADLVGFTLARARKKPGDLNNERKIRIASDFVDKPFVKIQETEYFSSVATDQNAWHRIHTQRMKRDGTAVNILWDGVDEFIEKESGGSGPRLRGLGEAAISNQVGASTLAFSDDGCLMIVHQNANNRQSVGWLAPSGSGSLDWSDAEPTDGSDLLTIVRRGAERELREECSLGEDTERRPAIRSRLMVTGFARMLHRAGKPEFFCLGRIHETEQEICRRKPERYVESVFSAQVERADWTTGRPSVQVRRICEAYLDKHFGSAGQQYTLSYPLQHSLQLLIELCRNPAAARKIDQFMTAK